MLCEKGLNSTKQYFRLFQIERICRRQFLSFIKMVESSPNGKKTRWKTEKLLIMSNFSFSRCVFKQFVLQKCKNKGLLGKGLTINKRTTFWLVEWCFTPLSTVFQPYLGNSSHYSCLSWNSPVLGWGSEVSYLSAAQTQDPWINPFPHNPNF